MDKNESIEIPLGAKDSELKGWEYTIPEGMEAEIKDGKIIVREKESEDERIRKQLLNWFKDCHWDAIDEDKTPLKREDIITWLEKQGEQKVPVLDFKTSIFGIGKALVINSFEIINL